MLVFLKLKKVLVKQLTELRWQSVALIILAYVVSSWLLLYWCGEYELTNSINFLYWLMVTGSTVGYGDFSPVTPAGKWVVAFYVIPFGLSLFALAVGRVATFMSYQSRKGVNGLMTLNVDNHILVMGWNESRTVQLLKLLVREQNYTQNPRRIVLCVDTKDLSNPLEDDIAFVNVQSYKDAEEMQRACLDSASTIIVDDESDDTSLSNALYCHGVNPKAHIIAYFKDESLSDLLKQHCPNVECTPSVSVEMLAKAAADPGSSTLHHELLNVDKGMTQYSIRVPEGVEVSVQDVFIKFKQHHEATIIGVRANDIDAIQLNPALDVMIKTGHTVFYIADERIMSMDWSA